MLSTRGIQWRNSTTSRRIAGISARAALQVGCQSFSSQKVLPWPSMYIWRGMNIKGEQEMINHADGTTAFVEGFVDVEYFVARAGVYKFIDSKISFYCGTELTFPTLGVHALCIRTRWRIYTGICLIPVGRQRWWILEYSNHFHCYYCRFWSAVSTCSSGQRTAAAQQ